MIYDNHRQLELNSHAVQTPEGGAAIAGTLVGLLTGEPIVKEGLEAAIKCTPQCLEKCGLSKYEI